jgi:hypothetical protein
LGCGGTDAGRCAGHEYDRVVEVHEAISSKVEIFAGETIRIVSL